MPDYATLYISDASLLGSKVFDTIEAIRSYEGLSEGESATGVRFDIEVAEVQVNFMPSQQIEGHLNGLAGYVQKVCQDRDVLVYTLSRVRHVNFVLGCVIAPGFDKDGHVVDFLLEFNGRLNGLLFIFDSIVDYDGEPLAGPLCG